MKVLRVINSLHIGGAERSVAGNSKYHLQNGFQFDVLLLNGERTFFLDELDSNGVKVITLGKNNNIYNPILIFKIIKLIKKYDVVHVSLFPALYWVALAKFLSRSNTRLVYTEHSTYNKRRNVFFKLIDKFIYNQYDKIIAISPEAEENLRKHIGSNHNISLIYNGVDLDKVKEEMKIEMFSEYSKAWKNKTIITQIAGFRSSKDQDTVIRSLKLLPNNFHCVFVGDGERLNECKELVKKNNLEERVTFLGLQKKIGAILKKTHIVVMSSHWEGFGRAAIEGMAAGKPVVGTNVSGLSEVLKNAGLLFSVGNEKQLAGILLELKNNESFYNDVSNKCLLRAEDFNIKTMIASYEKVYTS